MKNRIIFAFLFALIFIFPASAYSSSSDDTSTVLIGIVLVGAIFFGIYYANNKLEEKNKKVQTIRELTDQINNLKMHAQTQDIQEAKLNDEISELVLQLREKEKAYAQLQREYSQLLTSSQSDDLTLQLREKEKLYAQLQREHSRLLASSQGWEEKLHMVQNNLSMVSSRETKAHRKILLLEEEITRLQSELSALRQQNASTSKEKVRTDTHLQALKKECDDLKSVLARREHEFSQLQQAYDTLRASLRSLDSAEYKMLKPYLSTEEYQKLPQAQMHRLALERYQKRQRSEWEVGLGFERLIGYRYEKKGYTVEYVGATSGKEDMGRDLIVSNETEVFIVQCKRWSRGSQIHEKHIFQLQGTLTLYQKQHPDTIAIGVFITTAMLSPKAKETALSLGIEVAENFSYTAHPLVKCKADTKQYYLPMDSEYDKISINFASGDCYHKTVESAISAGFQSAYQ